MFETYDFFWIECAVVILLIIIYWSASQPRGIFTYRPIRRRFPRPHFLQPGPFCLRNRHHNDK